MVKLIVLCVENTSQNVTNINGIQLHAYHTIKLLLVSVCKRATNVGEDQ